jgi:class 3 adenylate cyclase
LRRRILDCGTSGLVTTLFTDLVGCTALSQAVGDTAADHVRREHFDVLRQAIGRTGGGMSSRSATRW